MANPGEQVTHVALTEDRLIVDLADGRSISVPLAWFPRLLHATSQERENWEIAGAGYGIHWPDVGFKCGRPASWCASTQGKGTGQLTLPYT